MTAAGVADLTFLGATGSVTGSKVLVEAGDVRVLLDCGLYQGHKELRLRNWSRLPVEPASIDAVVVSHAHVDHIGYLPVLVRDGFSGPVYVSPGTAALAAIVLPDAAHLAEEEAEWANRAGTSRHHPALPLFTREDAAAALTLLRTVPTGRRDAVAGPVSVELRRAGHILGATTVTVHVDGGPSITYSGDLGRSNHPLLLPPEPPPAGVDAVVLESTYGDRDHEPGGLEAFADAVARTLARGGVVVVPAFAVDRTEVLLLHLRTLQDAGRIPRVPVIVDSPMALAALGVYRRAIERSWPELRPETHLDPDALVPRDLEQVRTVEASKALNDRRGPFILLSASGMATGGRVLHHLARRLPDRRATVVLPGFQAPGTRGRSLLDGADAVKMLGRYVPVRAEIVGVGAFSVHAGASELIEWLAGAPDDALTYLVHGEPESRAALADRIRARLHRPVVCPRFGERVRIVPTGAGA
jgi:metallo-beta-lactamase family protein